MEKLDPIDVEFVLNSAEFKQHSDKVKAEITGVADSAMSASDRVSKEVQTIVADQNRLFEGLKGNVKRTAQDAVEAFEMMDPAIRRQMENLVLFENQLDSLRQAEIQLQNNLKAGSITQGQYNKSMAAIRAETAKTKVGMNELSAAIRQQGQTAATNIPQQKAQWNGLGNSINQISRELPAFTYSAQTGFMAISNNIPILVDEINRMKVANKAAAASGAATVPIWKAVGAAIFSWGTAISLAITLITVYGKEIGSFVSGLFSAKDAMDNTKKSQEALNEAFASSDYKKAVSGIIDLKTNLDLAKEGFISQKTVIDQYNESIGAVAGEVKTLSEVEQGMIDNADKYVQAVLYKAAALAAQEKIAGQLVESAEAKLKAEQSLVDAEAKLAEARIKNQKRIVFTPSGQAIESASIEENDVAYYERKVALAQKANDEIIESGNDLVEALKKQSLATGLDLFSENTSGTKSKGDSTLKARKDILEKIAALDAEYLRKSFTKDEEELQALRDKFAKVRELVTEWNADPKNRANRIDVSGLDGTESSAVANLTYRQETARMKTQLEEQKKIFQEYESWKLRFGEESAKDQYGAQIGEYESYMDYLRKLINDNQDTYTAITTGQASGGQTERYQVLEREAEEINRLNLEKNAVLVEQNRTHQQSLLLMEEKYQRDRAALIEQGKLEEVAVLDAKYDEEIGKLENANLRKTEAYKNLFLHVQRMTVAQAKTLIAAMDEELKHHKITADEMAKVEERKARLMRLIRNATLEDVSKIAGALGGLGKALEDLGTSSNSAGLMQIGGLMSGLASGVNDLLVAFDQDATSVDKISSGINGIINMVNMLAGAAAKRREAEESYYRSVIGFQNDYNLSLNEQIRLQSILGESVFLNNYEGRVKDGLAALNDANKGYQEALDKLNLGQAKSGQRNAVDLGNVGKGAGAGAAIGATIGSVVPVIGTAIGAAVGAIVGGLTGLFGGKKKKDTFLPLLSEYPELLQESEDGVVRINKELAKNLIENNLVDEKTKDILNNILEWETALEEARQQIRDVVGELAGSLGTDLRNSLVEAFRDGEDAAIAMGDSVEKVLENILSQLIFNKIFAEAFEKLEKEMISSQDVGGDGNWIDDFQRFFETAKGLGGDFNEAMQSAMDAAADAGFNIFQPTKDEKNQKGLSGAIRRELTEATGSELAGLFRGFFDVSKRGLILNENRFLLEKQHYEAMLQSINYQAAIESNTARTADKVTEAVTELKQIVKNTKQANGMDLGVGGP